MVADPARPDVIISDAGAYSDIVFGLLDLLGIEYRPEPADLPDTKLWHIDADADYGALATAARGRIGPRGASDPKVTGAL